MNTDPLGPEVLHTIRQLPDVISVADPTPGEEGPARLRLVFGPGVTVAHAIANLRALVKSRHGVDVPAALIEATVIRGADQGLGGPGRIQLVGVRYESDGVRGVAEVTLSRSGECWSAQAEGVATAHERRLSVARATLAAATLPWGIGAAFTVEACEAVWVQSVPMIAVVIDALLPSVDERYVGVSLVSESEDEHAARAVMSALNRVLRVVPGRRLEPARHRSPAVARRRR